MFWLEQTLHAALVSENELFSLRPNYFDLRLPVARLPYCIGFPFPLPVGKRPNLFPMDPASVETLLHAIDNLPETSDEGLYFADILSKYNASRPEGGPKVPVKLEYDSRIDQLSRLKDAYVSLRAEELFLEKLAAASAADGDALPCPTKPDLAAAEVAFEMEKAALKKVKLDRAEGARRLEDHCRAVGAVAVESEDAKRALKKGVRDARTGNRLRKIMAVLKNGEEDAVRELVAGVDQHDAKECEVILSHVFNGLEDKERALAEAEAGVSRLQSAIDRSVKAQSELNTRLSDYRAQIEQNEGRNADAPRLRELCAMNEKVYELLAALTRMKSSAMYDGGACLEVAIDRPVEPLEGREHGLRQSSVSIMYKVDVALGEGHDSLVTKLRLSPEPNVNMDCIVSDERPQTILQVTQAVVHLLSQTPVSAPSRMDDSSSSSEVLEV